MEFFFFFQRNFVLHRRAGFFFFFFSRKGGNPSLLSAAKQSTCHQRWCNVGRCAHVRFVECILLWALIIFCLFLMMLQSADKGTRCYSLRAVFKAVDLLASSIKETLFFFGARNSCTLACSERAAIKHFTVKKKHRQGQTQQLKNAHQVIHRAYKTQRLRCCKKMIVMVDRNSTSVAFVVSMTCFQ